MKICFIIELRGHYFRKMVKTKYIFLFSGAFGLQCWTCTGNAMAQDSCKLQRCPNDGQEWSCHNEIRIHGSQVWWDKGCKQKHSCETQAAQNNANYGGKKQCNPFNRMNSGKFKIYHLEKILWIFSLPLLLRYRWL